MLTMNPSRGNDSPVRVGSNFVGASARARRGPRVSRGPRSALLLDSCAGSLLDHKFNQPGNKIRRQHGITPLRSKEGGGQRVPHLVAVSTSSPTRHSDRALDNFGHRWLGLP